MWGQTPYTAAVGGGLRTTVTGTVSGAWPAPTAVKIKLEIRVFIVTTVK